MLPIRSLLIVVPYVLVLCTKHRIVHLCYFLSSPNGTSECFHDYQKQLSGPYSETYNPGWRNHLNFSWKQNQSKDQGGASNQAHNQYPLGFPPSYPNQGRLAQLASTSNYQALASTTQSLEDTFRDFMKMTSQSINDVKNSTMVNT